MKKTFNQKFGPENNPSNDQNVFKTIAKLKQLKKTRLLWFKWALASGIALPLIVLNLNLNSHNDSGREAYIQTVLEIQKSIDENEIFEASSDTFDLTEMATDET